MTAAPAMQNKQAQATTDDGMGRHLNSWEAGKRANLFQRARALLARRRLTVAWIVTLVVAVALACSEEHATPPSEAPVQVPPNWADARTFGGHAVHVGQKQLPCESCHALGASGFDRPAPERCIACHAAQGTTQHEVATARSKFGPATTAVCTSCHAFLPESPQALDHAAPSAWDCKRCHGASGSAQALEAHATADCQSCHQPHGAPAARAQNCVTCHATVAVSHGGVAGNECTTCHTAVHRKSSAAFDCAACHATTPPLVGAQALFGRGHDACVDCHKPHEFSKTEACTSCHQGLPKLGQAPAHAVCKNCHTPHDVRAAGNGACNQCHAALENDHPRDPKDCLSCHPAHPKGVELGAHGLGRPCSTCHTTATSDSAFHGGHAACTECHSPHHFLVTAAETGTCEACHASSFASTRKTGGHETCSGCHQGSVHASAQPAQACAQCHAGTARIAHPGHAECKSCHDPHAADLQKPCATCHAAELAAAPPGHRQCQACHEEHSTKMQKGLSCRSCHAKEASGLHGTTPGGCVDCHRAHGPKGIEVPPACSSCHETRRLPGLHAVQKHQDCTGCHSGHQASLPDERSRCLSCHQDRLQHFPESPGCSGCHSFKAW